jgi:hypothetical protein
MAWFLVTIFFPYRPFCLDQAAALASVSGAGGAGKLRAYPDLLAFLAYDNDSFIFGP